MTAYFIRPFLDLLSLGGLKVMPVSTGSSSLYTLKSFLIAQASPFSDSVSNFLNCLLSFRDYSFHEKKGCGVMDYFIHRKIDRAKEMIRDGTMNVTEISYFLSYSSLQYFSKQFKQITGMSPQQYASSVKGLSQSAQGSFIKPKLIK